MEKYQFNNSKLTDFSKKNDEKLFDDINQYIKSKKYQKYMAKLVEYDNKVGSLEDMIKEFIIPSINEYGGLIEGEILFSYQEYISKIINKLDEQDNKNLIIRRNLKENSLLDIYSAILDYPVNTLNKTITTVKTMIEYLTKQMDYEGKIEYQKKDVKIDDIMKNKKDEAERLYQIFDEKNTFITEKHFDVSSFDDFINIALLVDSNTEKGNIIFTLLFNLLTKINENISEDEKEKLLKKIKEAKIKNRYLLDRSVSILRDKDTLMSKAFKKDSSPNIKIALFRRQLKELMKKVDEKDEYTIESANSLKNYFYALTDELEYILEATDSYDEEQTYSKNLEKYKNIIDTRCNYEEEKQSINDLYNKVKIYFEQENRETIFHNYSDILNEILSRITELKSLIGKRIKLSKKDQTNFETMCSTIAKMKEQIINIGK